jgi:regulator of sirC expression with transglutaminase-like and TPR domain
MQASNMDEHTQALFASLVRDRRDEEIDLAKAALAIAAIVAPVAVDDRSLARLDADADWLATRLPTAIDVEQSFRRMCHFLAHERGYHGNRRDYYDPRNSCLNHVLTTKVGLPITLSIIYLEVGRRIGLDMAGVGLPGHFIIKAVDGPTMLLADPFNQGVLVQPAECAEIASKALGRRITLEPHDFAAVTKRQILARVLLNLRHLYLSPARRDYQRALATIEYSLVLRPSSLDDIRDRGLVLLQVGDYERATADLETYLTYAPDASDAKQVERHLQALRRQLPPGR